ncbi:hypothetical protein E3P92_01356 [Wallemia ichthyophaga]|uniref:30S ribosomal protein S6 n=2 Tax=Wallemia ichthyophaga TaxID=245174 RepID=A0A4T0IYZ6_WALIC|nr:uncharacterized protein J056_001548 [Wallemia ichthyophaga EXF-994]TIA74215.1 hypothetical protein E3P91_01065 [Wallemia ichthyophaga]EOQ99716.1 hypothetical protein J056_001548 [Wallemia ichthyophaga EXF-994]TIA82806.1 hypothetical protein E3P98_01185 [Wallemia ichthyophaga]TIA92600.1 hypothetical protein E3P97_01370 [Wallemia ichthyophaga]TIA98973.1 hypothetical protein E3P96_03028 [Wallemia ichthyophaga]
MPLYNILCIAAHYPEIAPIRELLKTTSSIINNGNGVIRSVDFWGTQTLPMKMRRHQEMHDKGDYINMQFMGSPRVLNNLNQLLRLDPRVVRWQTINQGAKLEDVLGK